MTDEKKAVDHRALGVECFNATWDLIDKKERTQAENDAMIHTAHASRYHWGKVGEPVNLARGEWQTSRVYALLKRAEPALYHATRSLQICKEHKIGDFDLAFAYEALARGYAVAGDNEKARDNLKLAKKAAGDIEDEGNKQYLLSELETIPGG